MSRGRRKQTLRDFTREFPAEEDKERFREAMNSPSDLVTAIVQSIEVEYLLEQLILAKLKRNDDDTVELLSKENGPLASFFSKIGLGYALGIFDAESMEYLNTIRRIRNAFAHSRKTISFATPLIRAELASLKVPSNKQSRMFKTVSLVRRLSAADFTVPQTPKEDALALVGRAAYVILCMTLSVYFQKKQNASARKRFARFRRFASGSKSDAVRAQVAKDLIKDGE